MEEWCLRANVYKKLMDKLVDGQVDEVIETIENKYILLFSGEQYTLFYTAKVNLMRCFLAPKETFYSELHFKHLGDLISLLNALFLKWYDTGGIPIVSSPVADEFRKLKNKTD